MTDTKTQSPSDAELVAFAIAEQFLLFCDSDEFVDIARAVLAKWGQPQAVAGGEPVAWLSVDCIGERYLCFTRPDDDDPVRPLVFGDTAPSVLEDAARYRWLREQPFDTWKLIAWNTWNNDPAVWQDRDAAIDAARKQGANHE